MLGHSGLFGKADVVVNILLSMCIAAAYVLGSHMLPQSYVSAEAALSIDAPFVYRLLLPYGLGLVCSPQVLDSFLLRFAASAISVFVILAWLPAYLRRLAPGNVAADALSVWVQAAGAAVLIAHYVLPHRFHFYYIYDLPAIVFYLALFLCLTSEHPWRWWAAVPLVAIFSLNRETVVVAVLHALVLNWSVAQGRRHAQLKLLAQSAVLVAVVALVRLGVMAAISAPHGEVVEYMDGQDIRLVANFRRVASQVQHTVTIAYFGFGLLVWLPMVWSTLPATLRQMFLWSLLPIGLLFVVGNPTELRIFNEFVPLFASGLAVFLSSRLPARWLPLVKR